MYSHSLKDWQHIQMINVFQEQLVTGQKTSRHSHREQPGKDSASEPMVNLINVTNFEEHFYLVVVEKLASGASVLHMWQIMLSSQGTKQAPPPPSSTPQEIQRIKQSVHLKG